jgi:hypothetical protein
VFKAQYSGKVTGMRFYKGSQNTGSHIGNLWTNTGIKLATVTFTNETTSGWQKANFSQPVSISANTTYVVSYFAPAGHYSVNNNYFTSSRVNGPLTALKNSDKNGNGVYKYGSQSGFPNQTYNASNYWVDVIYTSSKFFPTSKPVAPSKLTASTSGRTVTLGWQASPTTGVTLYDVYRNGVVVGSSSTTSFTDNGLAADTSYAYYVVAVDSANGASDPSNTVTVKTAADTQLPGPAPAPTPPPTDPGSGTGTSACTGAKHTPGGPDNSGVCWPGASNTGVPAGTTLSAYTGPCTITANNTVIDAKTINCDLTIQAANVQVKRSKINGSIGTDENSTGYSFTISDSEIDAGNRASTGVGSINFTATRLHIYGGNRSVHCYNNCTITDSYVHGQFKDPSGTFHESGIRMGQSATITHNTILCDAPDVPPDGGCSADLTGYGDFAPVQNNIIARNLFMPTTGGYCAYGGSSLGKPYSGQTNHITYKDNVFKRGTNLSQHGGYTCAYYGAITSFDTGAPGNVWSNNTWDDGSALAASN